MLFKNYIYVNEGLLHKLSKQIGIKISADVVKTSQTNKKAGIAITKFSAGAENIKTDTENLQNDKYDLLKIFEEKVLKDETGIIDFDFKEADHIFSGQLIKFTAKMLQPKSDEKIELINSVTQNSELCEIIKNSVDTSNVNEQKLLDLMFKGKNNIPIYFSNDDNYIVVSNITVDNLDISYEAFEDLYNEEVKALLLVDRKYTEQQDVILMDILKDVFKLGRNLRRAMPQEEQEQYIIKEKGPAIKGELLAIYN